MLKGWNTIKWNSDNLKESLCVSLEPLRDEFFSNSR